MGCFEETVGRGDVSSDFDDEYVGACAVGATASSAADSAGGYSHGLLPRRLD